MPRLTFNSLLQTPSITQLRDDAQSIAMHERWPWYERWIERSRIFAVAIHAAAEALGVAPEEIRGPALTGLLDAYHVARRRRAKRGANA
jgi:hypothetical protein